LKKLTDRQIKNIVCARAEGETYTAIAKKYKISPNTVRNYCNSEKDFAKICSIKKDENIKNVIEHMETKAEAVCEIIDVYLAELVNPSRLSRSNARDIATALGIVVDKFTKLSGNNDINKLDEVLSKIEGNI
jgi:endonuclease III-like uncharacterized protein